MFRPSVSHSADLNITHIDSNQISRPTTSDSNLKQDDELKTLPDTNPKFDDKQKPHAINDFDYEWKIHFGKRTLTEDSARKSLS